MKMNDLRIGLFMVFCLGLVACSGGSKNSPKVSGPPPPAQVPNLPANAVALTKSNGRAIVAVASSIQASLSLAAEGFPEAIGAGSCLNITGDDFLIEQIGTASYVYADCKMADQNITGKLDFSFNETDSATAATEGYTLIGNMTLSNASDTLTVSPIKFAVDKELTANDFIESTTAAFSVSSIRSGGFVVTALSTSEWQIQGAGNSKITYQTESDEIKIDESGNGSFVLIP